MNPSRIKKPLSGSPFPTFRILTDRLLVRFLRDGQGPDGHNMHLRVACKAMQACGDAKHYKQLATLAHAHALQYSLPGSSRCLILQRDGRWERPERRKKGEGGGGARVQVVEGPIRHRRGLE